MSRVGRKPITIPKGVTITVKDGSISVKGPKGELKRSIPTTVKVTTEKDQLLVSRESDDAQARAGHGLARALLNNMVEGVTKGYEKRLKIEGVGYQARLDKKAVVLTVGYANAITKAPPEGVTAEVPDATTIVIRGADKQKVGQFAAEVRAVRKPEPYKGKGIRYENEQVRRKEGKSFTSGG